MEAKSWVVVVSVLMLSQLSDAQITCADLKAVYSENECCEASAGKEIPGSGSFAPKEGPMMSVMPGMAHPKLIMGMDVDYPPYATLKKEPFTSSKDLDEVAGVGADMINGMAKHCGFEVKIMQVKWSECWNAGAIGMGLLGGMYHGCMTYTHASGARNRYLEFSDSWAIPNKPSGLIAKLTDGAAAADLFGDLSGKTVVDVTGWAPTSETLFFVKNQCTNAPFKGFTMKQGDDIHSTQTAEVQAKAKGPNDKALLAVLEGKADVMYIYGDQAANYLCAEGVVQEGWNCDIWKGFGTTFAYVQSGMFAWMHNGTTISMSKKGSGVGPFLDKCFDSFRKTKEFKDVCAIVYGEGKSAHSQINTCIPNDFFKEDSHFKALTVDHDPYMFPTKDQKGCSGGYCGCP